MPDLGVKLEPIGGRHAIEAMAFGVEWAGALDEPIIKECIQAWNLDPTLKEDLPAKNETSAQVISFGGGGNTPPIATPLVGVDFQKFNPNGVSPWTMSLRPSFLAVTCTEYDSWAQAYARAKSMLEKLVHVVMNGGHEIAALGLQYSDGFRILGDASRFEPAMLFDINSDRLPKAIFQEKQNWHVHQGWFRPTGDNRRMLNVTNIDIVEAPALGRLVRITSNHRTFAHAAQSDEKVPIRWNDADPIFDAMHDEDKAFLRSVLNREMAHRINLPKD